MLEQRLSEFYHWRMSLQITLKKYGASIGDMEIYHGVNEKMILNPHSAIQGFHGPLSTTSSFHVAKTVCAAQNQWCLCDVMCCYRSFASKHR